MDSHGTILVIDDEEIMREGCYRILSREGLEVIPAENGFVGLEIIRERKDDIDTILLDLMMPGMSGMEVLEKILEIDRDLITIVITGYATVESAVQAMKKGAYDFISKPFTPDQLRLVVKRSLEKRQLIKEAEYLRRERERSLRDIATEKSKLKTIINCMADGVLVSDRDGCIVLTNPAANLMLTLPDGQLIGRHITECDLPEELRASVEKSLSSDDHSFKTISQELFLERVKPLYLRAHTASVYAESGEIMGTVTILQDISHLKELDKMKSDFVAMVAHELRSPLATVEQQLGVILTGLAGEITETQHHLLTRAQERTRGVLRLIKDLLDLSKVEAGRFIQYKEPISLDELLGKIVEGNLPEAKAKNITLTYSSEGGNFFISADSEGMEVVFNNLLSNALKFTPNGGRVGVHLVDLGSHVKVVVSDTGIGIEKEDIPRIFDKFYRAKSTDKRRIWGTGLGLTIVKAIVDAHLGSINVESEVGKGSTFTVLLPKETEEVICP